MSKMKYEAVASFHAKPMSDQKNEEIVHLVTIPVRFFEVIGGANRMINLNSTDDISISSEFEQARTHHNITLFIPPSKDFTAVTLVGLRFVSFSLFVNIYAGKVITQDLHLELQNAWFQSKPAPFQFDKETLLKCGVQFNEAKLFYGKLDEERVKIVHREI